MNYSNPLPSLERLALIRTAIALWNLYDIRTIWTKNYTPFIDYEGMLKDTVEWKDLEDKVIEKVLQLPQPKCLKEKITYFIKPIGLQILDWMESHRNWYLEIDLPKELCWSPQGTVDGKRTAEMLIKDENLHITSRYKLACMYCLEDDISELWNKMPSCDIGEGILVNFWTYSIKGEVAKWINDIDGSTRYRHSPYHYAFYFSSIKGNKVAAEYFLRKLNSTEREECFVEFIRDVLGVRKLHSGLNFYLNYSDIVCFLLSQMNEEQQVEVFRNHSFDILNLLLNWPWQDFFMETAKKVWSFLDRSDFTGLLTKITSKLRNGYKDYNYQKLFRDFWQQSPINFKEDRASLLSELLEIEDIANVRLILEDASTSEKERILNCENGKRVCENLIYNDKSDLMKLFVQECISSKTVLIKFKEEFKERLYERAFGHTEEGLARAKYIKIEFVRVMDDLIQEKRGSEEGNSSQILGSET